MLVHSGSAKRFRHPKVPSGTLGHHGAPLSYGTFTFYTIVRWFHDLVQLLCKKRLLLRQNKYSSIFLFEKNQDEIKTLEYK